MLSNSWESLCRRASNSVEFVLTLRFNCEFEAIDLVDCKAGAFGDNGS